MPYLSDEDVLRLRNAVATLSEILARLEAQPPGAAVYPVSLERLLEHGRAKELSAPDEGCDPTQGG
jgi:hypothetical protein